MFVKAFFLDGVHEDWIIDTRSIWNMIARTFFHLIGDAIGKRDI